MATTLWAKGYTHEPAIARFEASRNAGLDVELARYDVLGSLAHARMLRRIGLLSAAEWSSLDGALRTLLGEANAGQLRPTAEQEDIHTLVETILIARIGDAGKKLHTGRSRNDQALVDLRLYAKASILELAGATLATAETFVASAKAYEWVPMPGYTHMQRAMLSSVGLWQASYAESLLDDLQALEVAYALNDQSPLGSAAAYGVPLPLDRAYVARLLGFAGVHHNTLTAANGRGKIEAATISALSLVMLDLSKWAQDVLLYTTSEYGLFTVPAELCDGSSIMPQKRNLSALELVRARAHTVASLHSQALHTLAGLPSGYNMDYQETKQPLIDAIALTAGSLDVVKLFVAAITPNRDALEAACAAELFATDHAYALTAQGIPFRDAYRLAAAEPSAQEPGDLELRLRARSHAGAPGTLGLDNLSQRIATTKAAWTTRTEMTTSALDALSTGALPAPDATSGASDSETWQTYSDVAIALGI